MFLLPLLLHSFVARAFAAFPDEIAASYPLTTSTSLAFPTATSTVANTFLPSQWNLKSNRVLDGPDNIAFVADPFPAANSSSNATVLQVAYPEHTGGIDTGATFFSLFNSSANTSAMLLSYQVAFDATFNFSDSNGLMPGLRGGSSATECMSTDASDGHNCINVQPEWRTDATGEVLAWIPTANLCNRASFSCDELNGAAVSIDRGAFSFAPGKWQNITLFVWLNEPADQANGYLALYYNDQLVSSQNQLQLRAGKSVTLTGLYFSTFFEGTTPTTQRSYYRDIQLWAGDTGSNMTGVVVKASPSTRAYGSVTALHIAGLGILSLIVTAYRLF